MPVTAILHLRAISSGKVRRSFHCLMHPVFLERIAKADPRISEKLHEGQNLMGYSISPVMGVMRERIEENGEYWVRIGILEDEIEEAFLATLEQGFWKVPIHLENHFFLVEDVVVGEQAGNPWSGRESYQDMVVNGGWLERKMTLLLESPMSFKRGDLHYPLPEPGLIFGNLRRRWNQYSRFPVPEEFEFDRISFANLKIRTKPYALRKGGTILGMLGRMTFIIKAADEITHCCNVLLRFAFYAGIGVKTTQGMGMCRVTGMRKGG